MKRVRTENRKKPKPKPICRLRRIVPPILPLSNADEHKGAKVRMVAGKYRGEEGVIKGAILCKKHGGVHYKIETTSAILVGVVWTDFQKLH